MEENNTVSEEDFIMLDGCVELERVRHNFGHNFNAYQHCLNHFHNDFKTWADEVEVLIKQRKLEGAARQTHKLKGAAANIYAISLSNSAAELYAMLLKGEWGAFTKVKNQLDVVLRKISAKTINKKGA